MRLAEIAARALVRLIPRTYHKPPVLRGLVDGEDELAVLAEIEGLTSGRLTAEREGLPGLDRRELAFRRRTRDLAVYGDGHVNAAFAYTRPTGNRFNDGGRGAWYCAWETRTAVAEVAFHRTRELRYIGVMEDEAPYVELLSDVIGTFPDLASEPNHPALDPDPARGYPAGQSLALDLRREGHAALVYPSVRDPGGRCLVAFDPGAVRNVRPGAAWDIVWRGTEEYELRAA